MRSLGRILLHSLFIWSVIVAIGLLSGRQQADSREEESGLLNASARPRRLSATAGIPLGAGERSAPGARPRR